MEIVAADGPHTPSVTHSEEQPEVHHLASDAPVMAAGSVFVAGTLVMRGLVCSCYQPIVGAPCWGQMHEGCVVFMGAPEKQ